jgi:hypothetical protein
MCNEVQELRSELQQQCIETQQLHNAVEQLSHEVKQSRLESK